MYPSSKLYVDHVVNTTSRVGPCQPRVKIINAMYHITVMFEIKWNKTPHSTLNHPPDIGALTQLIHNAVGKKTLWHYVLIAKKKNHSMKKLDFELVIVHIHINHNSWPEKLNHYERSLGRIEIFPYRKMFLLTTWLPDRFELYWRYQVSWSYILIVIPLSHVGCLELSAIHESIYIL